MEKPRDKVEYAPPRQIMYCSAALFGMVAAFTTTLLIKGEMDLMSRYYLSRLPENEKEMFSKTSQNYSDNCMSTGAVLAFGWCAGGLYYTIRDAKRRPGEKK